MFGLGYMTHSWPGRWCSLSSCNFPSMQTRSQRPGGSSDRSTWERLISRGGARAFSSAKSVHIILLAHVGEATDESRHPPSHCSGDAFSSLHGSGGKKLPLPFQALRGQDSGPSERFCLFWAGSGPSSS